MIVRDAGRSRFLDLEAVSTLLQRSTATIRAKCTSVACDVRTRRGLYDPMDVEAAMLLIPVRKRVDKRAYIRV